MHRQALERAIKDGNRHFVEDQLAQLQGDDIPDLIITIISLLMEVFNGRRSENLL